LKSWQKPKPAPQTLRELAQTSDALICWETLPNGVRWRWWCKYCRDEGKPWLMEQTCGHVKNAKPEANISREKAIQTLESLMSERPITQPSDASQP